LGTVGAARTEMGNPEIQRERERRCIRDEEKRNGKERVKEEQSMREREREREGGTPHIILSSNVLCVEVRRTMGVGQREKGWQRAIVLFGV